MTTRPSGKIEWATLDAYDVGPETGTPNKTVPDAATIARGKRPGHAWPATYQNWQENRVARFLSHRDAFEVLNWSTYVEIAPGEAADAVCVFVSTSKDITFFAIGDQVHRTSTAVGLSWAVESLPGAVSHFRCGASNGDLTVLAGDTPTIHTYVESTATWDDLPTSGVAPLSSYNAACAFGSRIFLVGSRTAGMVEVPIILGVNAVGAGLTLPHNPGAVPSGFAPDCILTLVAASPDLIVAVAWDADADPLILWSTDGTTWHTQRPVLPDTHFVALAWDESESSFELFAIDGSIYSSGDGATWGLRVAAPTPTPNALVGRDRTIAVAGGLWLGINATLSGGTGNDERIVYSVDRGVSWRSLGNLFQGFDATFSTPEPLACVTYCGGRFWAAAHPGAPGDEHGVIRSMRTE